MNKLTIYALAVSLATASIVAMDVTPKRGRLSRAYHNTTDRLSNHKGKVGLAVGAIGTGVVYKIFHKEFDSYVKPLIKSVWKKTTGWIKRIFRGKKD
jgi:hypothetical protein